MPTTARITQATFNVPSTGVTNARVTQATMNVMGETTSNARVTSVFLNVMCKVSSGPVGGSKNFQDIIYVL